MAKKIIIGKAGGKHLVAGQEYKVSEVMAELLIKKGAAYEKGKKPKKATKKTTKKAE